MKVYEIHAEFRNENLSNGRLAPYENWQMKIWTIASLLWITLFKRINLGILIFLLFVCNLSGFPMNVEFGDADGESTQEVYLVSDYKQYICDIHDAESDEEQTACYTQ